MNQKIFKKVLILLLVFTLSIGTTISSYAASCSQHNFYESGSSYEWTTATHFGHAYHYPYETYGTCTYNVTRTYRVYTCSYCGFSYKVFAYDSEWPGTHSICDN